MRFPIAADLESRDGTLDADALLTNAFAEIVGRILRRSSGPDALNSARLLLAQGNCSPASPAKRYPLPATSYQRLRYRRLPSRTPTP